MRAYGLTPRCVGELKARDTRAARRPLRTHRTVAALSGSSSGDGGDACVSPQASPPKVGTLEGSGNAMVPVVLTGRRDCEIAAARGHPAATLEVAPDVSALHQAQDRYVA